MRKVNSKDNCGDCEEEAIDDADLDDLSPYEIENDAKRYKNKVFLHNTDTVVIHFRVHVYLIPKFVTL